MYKIKPRQRKPSIYMIYTIIYPTACQFIFNVFNNVPIRITYFFSKMCIAICASWVNERLWDIQLSPITLFISWPFLICLYQSLTLNLNRQMFDLIYSPNIADDLHKATTPSEHRKYFLFQRFELHFRRRKPDHHLWLYCKLHLSCHSNVSKIKNLFNVSTL